MIEDFSDLTYEEISADLYRRSIDRNSIDLLVDCMRGIESRIPLCCIIDFCRPHRKIAWDQDPNGIFRYRPCDECKVKTPKTIHFCDYRLDNDCRERLLNDGNTQFANCHVKY